MKFMTNALIIKEQSIGEKDKLLTVLSDSHGVIKGFARGAKDIKSSRCAATGLLSYSRLTLHKTKDSCSIGDAKPIKAFTGLSKSIENMYCAQYFCELCSVLCPKEQEAGEQLRLVLNALYLLSEKGFGYNLVKPCVELRLMCLDGYMPDILMCRECGEYEKDDMFFLPKSGQLVCRDCYDRLGLEDFKVKLTRAALTAMRHCCYADSDKIFGFKLPESDLRILNFCSEEYIRFMLERSFKTLQFLKTLT